MDRKGLSPRQVFDKLKKFHEKDMDYKSGRILGSMCTCAHPVAKKAYCDFLESNLGDPGLFEGTKALEDEVISLLGAFLCYKSASGHVITGGTEANLMAMRAARNMARINSAISSPEIIVPKSAHFSFKKAADILGLRLLEAELDENYKIDLNSVQELLSSRTVAVVGVAGTTELGKVDPIGELSRICHEGDVYLHVDAAFGGFIIPFLKEMGFKIPEFNFKLNGVSSITVDPHKLGLTPIPTGCILFREKKFLDIMSIETPYLTEKQQSTIVGTRTGASAAATWAILKHMGKEGYLKIASSAMEITNFLARELTNSGFELVSEPELNIVAFNSRKIPAKELSNKLKQKGWVVSVSACPPAIRIVLMPHIRQEHIVEFMDDLKSIHKSTHLKL
ncbi:MAG: tyrosine decarboxylase MfnA [Euryarchaeota archaeon]|nr:tyrosine decarboxylase MfnA [Euryarchaeota archaeon]MBV1729671.1 tyrosine decarboxylase MfnA [Methanobacterium sp.]MBU4548304.1 tyrosine decarboxylase MfnA [Euryarchaeota archaeon]MBU4607504.1 tyrosine decarboxylase MfnA [Euryarchaeota archaeon]MBV1754454.1 tyrosine decarboxylase MfnA [Methanobacterium sp.]